MLTGAVNFYNGTLLLKLIYALSVGSGRERGLRMGRPFNMGLGRKVMINLDSVLKSRDISLAMGFPRQEYCSGLPFPFPRDLSNPGIKHASLVSPALAVRFFTTSTIWEAHRRFLIKQDFCWIQVREIAHNLGDGGG